MKNRDRVEIIRMVGKRYSTLPQKKWSQRSSRPPEQVLFSSESSDGRGARQAHGHGRRGTQGRGRGGSCSKDGDSSSKGGGSSCGGGRSSANSASDSSHGGDSRSHGGCWRCNRRGHIREKGTTEEGDFFSKCVKCSGFGHEESTCSSDAAVLVMKME